MPISLQYPNTNIANPLNWDTPSQDASNSTGDDEDSDNHRNDIFVAVMVPIMILLALVVFYVGIKFVSDLDVSTRRRGVQPRRVIDHGEYVGTSPPLVADAPPPPLVADAPPPPILEAQGCRIQTSPTPPPPPHYAIAHDCTYPPMPAPPPPILEAQVCRVQTPPTPPPPPPYHTIAHDCTYPPMPALPLYVFVETQRPTNEVVWF
jgi:hypothetical protein